MVVAVRTNHLIFSKIVHKCHLLASRLRPCPGKIRSMYVPGGPGARIDSAMYAGYTIPPYYDSMIAKLIVHAPTRQESLIRFVTSHTGLDLLK